MAIIDILCCEESPIIFDIILISWVIYEKLKQYIIGINKIQLVKNGDKY